MEVFYQLLGTMHQWAMGTLHTVFAAWFFIFFWYLFFSNISLGIFKGNIENWRYLGHILKHLVWFYFYLFFKE